MITRVILLSILSCLLSFSCGQEEEEMGDVIAQKVAERLAGFRKNFSDECRDKVLEAARTRADSLLRDRARRLSLLAGRPPKPRRPGAPVPRSLSRELPLRPLFPFEVRFDTLLRDSLYQDSLRLDSILLEQLKIDSLR